MEPSQDLLSPARRPLDVEDYIDIVRRHKGWIVGPAFLALVVSVAIAFLLANTYVSEATVQVVPSQVPERLVPSNVNAEMSQRVISMAQQIRSRPSLINIITKYRLYAGEQRPMEDIIEKMNRAINISPVTSMQTSQPGRTPMSAFKVSFAYHNRILAQRVTAELVGAFISQNILDLQSQSVATTDFMKEQWEAASRRLQELEDQMEKFKLENAGRLPDQMQANLQNLGALQTQLAGINDAIARIDQEKVYLESQLRLYKDQLAAQSQNVDQVSLTMKSEQLAQAERAIATTEAALATLRERYQPTHPDIKATEAQLAIQKRRRDDLLKQEQNLKPSTPRIPSPAEEKAKQELEAAIARTEGQINAKNVELEQRTKTQAQLNEALKGYQARIQTSPIVDRKYAELTRDYTLAREKYDDLNKKKSQSEMASSLERRGHGERLEPLDPASLPEKPIAPDRRLIIGAGFGIGLVLGAIIAGAREMKDTSLKNLKDARAYTNLPVLGTVPLLQNDLVVRRKRRLAWLAWATAFIIGVLAMSASVYYYYTTTV